MDNSTEYKGSYKYDFFVSYAHKDNDDGWITEFIEAIQREHTTQYEPQPFKIFIDNSEIRTMDDWEHRILGGLRNSKLMVVMLSPKYFESEYCRKEWKIYLEYELDKAMQGEGIATLYIQSVSAFEQDTGAEHNDWLMNLRRRQYMDLRKWHYSGSFSLKNPDIRPSLQKLEQDISLKLAKAERISSSKSNFPTHNRYFVGRVDDLRRLREIVALHHVGEIVLVQGLAGIGKSALVFEYAHQNAAEYPGGRFFIDCSGTADLGKIITKLAIPMEIKLTDDEIKNDKLGALRIRTEFENRHRSLVLLDGVDDIAFVEHYFWTNLFPSSDNVHVIMTTKLDSQQFPSLECLSLSGLSDSDSLRLLEKYRPFTSNIEKEAAHQIVKRLEGYPLALEVIAVYLWQKSEISYKGYLDRLEQEGLDAVEGAALEKIPLSRHGQKSMSKLLESTLESLSRPEKLALSFASLLPLKRIPLPWLQTLVGELEPSVIEEPKPGYPDLWLKVKRHLLGLRLIREGDDPHIVEMGSLIGEIVTKSCNPLEMEDLLQRAVFNAIYRGKASRMVFDDSGILRVGDFSWWESEAVQEFAILLMDKKNFLGYPLAHLAATLNPIQLSKNEALQRRVVAAEEDRMIAGQLSNAFLAEAYFNLSETVMMQDRFEESKELLQRAITILKSSGNLNDLRLNQFYLQLQGIDQMQSQYRFAMEKMREHYQNQLFNLGQNHPETLLTEEWLREHDPVWLDKFKKSLEYSKIPISLVNLREADECDQYIHRCFLQEEAKSKLLPFDEARTRKLLV
jgi:hypothetical protein